MKKLVFSIGLALSLSSSAFGQWVTKSIDNGFDDKFKVAYTDDGQKAFLKLEEYEGKAVLLLKGIYFCDSPLIVEMSYQVNGVNKKYAEICELNDAETTAFVNWDLQNAEYYQDFKNSTSVKIRVTDGVCNEGDEIFTFKMSGSTNALNFITNK